MLNEFYLYDYAFVVNKIKSLNSELENLEGLRAVVIDDMPKGSNVSSTVENELLKIEKIKEKIEKLKAKERIYLDLFSKLTYKEKLFIELRYVHNKTYREMAKELKLNEHYLPRKKNFILEKLAK